MLAIVADSISGTFPVHLIILSTFTKETKTLKLSKHRVLVNTAFFFFFFLFELQWEMKNCKAKGSEGTIYVAWEKLN